jgi:spoIIIJ-associated protein
VEAGVSIEASGETVGEAKWAALRELERRLPGLDRDAVRFVVLAEGERGLMGVGREPARVLASVDQTAAAPQAPADAAPAAGAPRRERPARPAPAEDDSPEARRLREILTAICAGVGVQASVRVVRDADGLTATLHGSDLGVLIGRRGHTIDAVQYLVTAILHHETGERPAVTVDAQDYRRRREASLRDAADRAVQDVVRRGEPVSLEPMSSAERKVVHLYLQDHADVVTESAGREPHRYVVVARRAD